MRVRRVFRTLRIAVLLVILATVAVGAWRSGARATEWKHTLHATVYPIAADASPQTRASVAEPPYAPAGGVCAVPDRTGMQAGKHLLQNIP